MRTLKQFLILCVWCQIIGITHAASIRNPADVDDIIDLDHDHLTFRHHHFSDDVISAQYHFRMNKGDNFVPLRPNTYIDLNAPMCYIADDGNLVCELGNEKNTQFYNDDANSVAVAISNENGTLKMEGILHNESHTIDINPLQAPDLPSNRYHVIKKRWTANIIRPESHTRTKRDVPRKQKTKKTKKNKSCGSCNGGVKIGIGIGISIGQQKYKPIPPIYKKPSPFAYCIDILAVVDYSIYKKFLQTERTPAATMKKIRYYYAHVINGVNLRYATLPSKKFQINVRLAGYFIAKRSRDLAFIDAKKMQQPGYRVDSNYTLTNLDIFLKKVQNNKRKRSSLPDFNHAMLFLEYSSTNLGGSVLDDMGDEFLEEPVIAEALQHEAPKDDISGDKGGTSFVSGMCSRSKSTSLVVDHGAYTSAGIATHELGHNLGVFFHDGEGTARSATCNASRNYIMAPASFLIDENNLRYSFTFSTCSVKQIQDNIKRILKVAGTCIKCSERERSRADEQMDHEFQLYLEKLPGQIDDVHTQCQQLYGRGSFMCPPKSPEEMCYRMYCYDPRRGACAIISEQMAAPGTPCGKYKICQMGKCVKDTKLGQDVLDDCPYPDIPSSGAHCEDATPFMCKNPKFRQKCCKSCNKEFTEEESCKDSHYLINGMRCKQLMVSIYGRPGCSSDYNVKNMCCTSCRKLLSIGGGNVMIHIGIGSKNAPEAPRSRYSKMRNKNNKYNKSMANKVRQSKPTQLAKQPSKTQKQSSYKPQNNKQQYNNKSQNNNNSKNNNRSQNYSNRSPGTCVDKTDVRINNLLCHQLVTAEKFCRSCLVQENCCASCKKYGPLNCS